MQERLTTTLLGVPIDLMSFQLVIEHAVEAIDGLRPQTSFACANPHSLVVAQTKPKFLSALNNANLVVADGVGVTTMARLAKLPIGPRITGEDFFHGVMQALQDRGEGRIFFFGSSEHVLSLIRDNCANYYPAVTICGVLSPPYREWSQDENQEMIEQINVAKPDVLWVGMTAPKQENWIQDNRSQLDTPLLGAIGAVFDFFAGTHPRAPRWMCSAGIEWLYRLTREPKRMWHRNFVSTQKFIGYILLRHVLKIDAIKTLK